jgi:5-methylcytosine-specific restriction endonuclease McrA
MDLSSLKLDTLADRPRMAIPKPRAVIEDRIAYKRGREQQARSFRAQVWLRDEGKCRVCGRKVIHSLELVPNRGDVHHLETRGAHPEKRFDPANGVLLCAVCHPKVQRGAMKVPGGVR